MAGRGRDEGLGERGLAAEERDSAAECRDTTADARDARAVERDQSADLRDDKVARGEGDPTAGRVEARQDRQQSALDRSGSRRDRLSSASDRALSRAERADLLVDELTGAYRRAAGFLELEREIIKAERTRQPFVLGFLDVDGLKAVNDRRGHSAGDRLLRQVVDLLTGQLREYDVVVRFGGDEFVCGLPDVSLDEARQRLEHVDAALREAEDASITFGVVERRPGEGLEALIERADVAMYEVRARRGGPSGPSS